MSQIDDLRVPFISAFKQTHRYNLIITLTGPLDTATIYQHLKNGANPKTYPTECSNNLQAQIKKMLHDVIVRKRFGEVISYSYTVEFWLTVPPVCYLFVTLKDDRKRSADGSSRAAMNNCNSERLNWYELSAKQEYWKNIKEYSCHISKDVFTNEDVFKYIFKNIKKEVNDEEEANKTITSTAAKKKEELSVGQVEVEKANLLMKKVEDITNNITKAIEGTITNSLNSAVSQITGMVTANHVELSNSLTQLSGWVSSSLSANQYMYPTTSPFDNFTPPSVVADPFNSNYYAGSSSYDSTFNQCLSQKRGHKPFCVFCKSNDHLSRLCCTVKSINKRLTIISRSGRCTNCFRIPNRNHYSTCEASFCHRGCVNEFGTAERHSDWYCPRNPDLEP